MSFGSTHEALTESVSEFDISYMRVRALPLTDEVLEFIKSKKVIYVVEQNRDGQLLEIIKKEWETSTKLISICQYDGLPMTADFISQSLNKEISS